MQCLAFAEMSDHQGCNFLQLCFQIKPEALAQHWYIQIDSDYSFSIVFLCSILKPNTENKKECWDKMVWKCGLRFLKKNPNCALNVLLKKVFLKANLN